MVNWGNQLGLIFALLSYILSPCAFGGFGCVVNFFPPRHKNWQLWCKKKKKIVWGKCSKYCVRISVVVGTWSLTLKQLTIETLHRHTQTLTHHLRAFVFLFFFLLFLIFLLWSKGQQPTTWRIFGCFYFDEFLILICCVCALLFFGWFVYVWCIAMLITLLDCADCPLRATSSSKKQIFLVQGVKQKKKTQTTYWQDTPNVW